MYLTKRKNNHYLLVKLEARDQDYLKGLKRHKPLKHVKSMYKCLSEVISLPIIAIFIMTPALMLEAEKKITKKTIRVSLQCLRLFCFSTYGTKRGVTSKITPLHFVWYLCGP